MTTNPLILDMLGDDLKTAITAAQTRTSDATITARIEAGQCIVSRGGVDIAHGLSIAAAVTEIEGLS